MGDSRIKNEDLEAFQAAAIERISSYGALSPREIALLRDCFDTRFMPGDTMLCREGEVRRSLFFLHGGMARGFFHRDGKDITTWFSFEGQVAAVVRSLFYGEPSGDALVLMEDSVVTVLDYAAFENLFDEHPAMLRLAYNLMREYFVLVDDRTIALQCNSAEERLRDLLKSEPRIMERVPAYHIATYLGITPETLSRVRAKVFASP